MYYPGNNCYHKLHYNKYGAHTEEKSAAYIQAEALAATEIGNGSQLPRLIVKLFFLLQSPLRDCAFLSSARSPSRVNVGGVLGKDDDDNQERLSVKFTRENIHTTVLCNGAPGKRDKINKSNKNVLVTDLIRPPSERQIRQFYYLIIIYSRSVLC